MIKVKEKDIMYSEREKFKEITDKINATEKDGIKPRIGILNEKIMHKVLKFYHEPDENFHERKAGTYIADIFKDGAVTEIQTGNLRAAREKNKFYLAEPSVESITMVYPLKSVRHLCWIDKETGEMSKSTRSPKFNDIFSLYSEIYYLKDFLAKEKFCLKVMLLEVSEIKFLDGWSKDRKRGATKIEAVPLSVIKTYTINSKESLKCLFPEKILAMTEFTSKDIALHSGISGRPLYSFLKVMRELEVIYIKGKKSRLDLYTFCE